MRELVLFLAVVGLGTSLPPGCVLVAQESGRETSEQDEATTAAAPKATSLRMSAGVVCRSIDGYEDYEPLPDAAQTAEEKLLVYFRPSGHKVERVDGYYHAHLVPDFQIRKRGEKAVLLQKLRFYEYKPRQKEPPRFIYMKNVIALKGLKPGDYDLTITLHDELAKGPPATQVVKFRVIAPVDLEKTEK